MLSYFNFTSHADLTRQYKTMQSEMALRIHMLEQTVNKLREQLGGYLWRWFDIIGGGSNIIKHEGYAENRKPEP